MDDLEFQMNYEHVKEILDELSFKQKREEDCMKLMQLYELFQQVYELPYPLTPHITLAYYKSCDRTNSRVDKLQEVYDQLNEEKIMIPVSIHDLFYQHFTSMNHYEIIY